MTTPSLSWAITITSPADGATFALGAVVNASYLCNDGPFGVGVATCAGPTSSGSAIDTTEEGDLVRLGMDRPGSAKRRSWPGVGHDLPVVYEDEAVIVLNKPAGLLAVPLPLERRNDARSVFEDLKMYLRTGGRRRPFVVHRIDRDTSGLVLFAKSEAAQLALKEQFKRRQPERVYRAIVYGVPSPSSGTWQDHLVWDTKALIQKETSPRDPLGQESI